MYPRILWQTTNALILVLSATGFSDCPIFFISPLTSHFYKIIEIEKRKNILFRNTELFTIRIVKDYRHNT